MVVTALNSSYDSNITQTYAKLAAKEKVDNDVMMNRINLVAGSGGGGNNRGLDVENKVS